MRRILVCVLFALFTAQLVSAEVTLTERQDAPPAARPAPKGRTSPCTPGRSGSGQGHRLAGADRRLRPQVLHQHEHHLHHHQLRLGRDVGGELHGGGRRHHPERRHHQLDPQRRLRRLQRDLHRPDRRHRALPVREAAVAAERPRQTGLPTKGTLPDYIMYNQNGPATTECNGRQVVLPIADDRPRDHHDPGLPQGLRAQQRQLRPLAEHREEHRRGAGDLQPDHREQPGLGQQHGDRHQLERQQHRRDHRHLDHLVPGLLRHHVLRRAARPRPPGPGRLRTR